MKPTVSHLHIIKNTCLLVIADMLTARCATISLNVLACLIKLCKLY